MKAKLYGITELNEHGRVVVRLLGEAKLRPGTMVEVRPVDEAATPIRKSLPSPSPVMGVLAA